MHFQYIIVDEQLDDSIEPAYYGPYPTEHIARELLRGNPEIAHLRVVGLGMLRRTTDCTSMHPESTGV